VVAGLVEVLREMKTLAKVLGGALLLGLAAWTGAYLYWHIKILGIVRSLETHAPVVGSTTVSTEYRETVDQLTDSGCRSLSYLAGSLGSSKAPWETSKFFFRICCMSFESGHKGEEHSYIPASQLQEECMIDPADSAAVRKQKIDRIRAWWTEAGPDLHQWWRVWSPNCRGARAGSGR
jgi:hypothetical protein